ncbi:MAG: methyltransferase [Nocardiopsaceae bacterium]|nr:methyltransferase [Nocardiopsaceae bacterium]
MSEDPAVVARLRAAGCVFAEEEAGLLQEAAQTLDELESMIGQRVAGLPLEQVVGWAEFCGLRIHVEPGVFVPRRRSEFLVETAVTLAAGHSPVIVDLCCGSGALGVAVASKLDGGELHAADVDPAAVACARRNVETLGGPGVSPGERCGPTPDVVRGPGVSPGEALRVGPGRSPGHVYSGDLFAPLPQTLRGRVTTLLCNAPYVPTGEIALLPAEARDYEHRVALDGGDDGLAVLRRAASGAPGWLAPGGHLLVETSGRQAEAMADVMVAAGLEPAVHQCDDYGSAVVSATLA